MGGVSGVNGSAKKAMQPRTIDLMQTGGDSKALLKEVGKLLEDMAKGNMSAVMQDVSSIVGGQGGPGGPSTGGSTLGEAGKLLEDLAKGDMKAAMQDISQLVGNQGGTPETGGTSGSDGSSGSTLEQASKLLEDLGKGDMKAAMQDISQMMPGQNGATGAADPTGASDPSGAGDPSAPSDTPTPIGTPTVQGSAMEKVGKLLEDIGKGDMKAVAQDVKALMPNKPMQLDSAKQSAGA